MRAAPLPWIESFRIVETPYWHGSAPRSTFGAFCVGELRIISSGARDPKVAVDDARAWEHVSVSTPTRIPTWDEMTRIAEAFWTPDETLLQFRPDAKRYVNRHPFCLHWWKPPYPVVLPPISAV